MIAVYVSGAVSKPGVYTLPLGSRVADAIAAAGGPAGSADLEQINLAARVADEEHLAVPAKGENPVAAAVTPPGEVTQRPAPSPTRGATSAQRQPKPTTGKAGQGKAVPDHRIDINSASAKELEELPGIGPVLAQRIVAYRQQNGSFASVEDLKLVKGIGDAIFARVRDYVVVNGP
jgi:competence protein ComEA